MLKAQHYVFILGHMRCYSTLLSHLLGSHRDISGYTELHQSYQSLSDFKGMRQKINFAYDHPVNSRYLLDKILHNQYRIDESIVQMPQVHLIFLLRRPEPTIKSIIEMGYRLDKTQWFKQPQAVLNYYRDRLQQLTVYAQQSTKAFLFIEAESVLAQSVNVLGSIQDFLELDEPIDSEYSPFKLTGKEWYGDSTAEIHSGCIKRSEKPRNDITLSDAILNQAYDSYERCRRQLQQSHQ